MSRRSAVRVAWLVCGASIALAAAGASFMVLARFGLDELTAESAYLNDLLVALAFPIVGALIAARQPANPAGWIFLAVGGLVAFVGFAGGYSIYAHGSASSLPGIAVMGWFNTWAWIPAFGVMGTFLILLFPDGRLPSRRWRPVAWLAGAGIVVATLALAVYPEPLDDEFLPGVQNPFGIERAEQVTAAIALTGGAIVLACTVASVVALVQRFRRAHGVERQQLKWFTYAAVLLGVLVLGTVNVSTGVALGLVQAILIGPGLALAVGVAMLRHRLYDIDVVINKTLVYGVLTALLGGTYLGLVLLLQVVFGPLTEDSDLAIAGSTLAVAALFRPVRRRIQEAVDRRFYRRRYDAARTLEAFSARLREEIDLEALSRELSVLVRETMQPAHVSLWLRGAGR